MYKKLLIEERQRLLSLIQAWTNEEPSKQRDKSLEALYAKLDKVNKELRKLKG